MTTANKKWMSSGFLQAAPVGDVSQEKGVIEGVSVCTVGEAKGHGVNLDSEFVGRVEALGNEKKQGLKARFGHPNMCSTALGTFIGRFKHFRQGTTVRDGQEVETVLADLFLSNEAKDTPHGDLYSYVVGMATNEPDMFGTSIVFTPGETYVRDEEGEKVYDYYEVDPFTGCKFAKKEYEELPIFVECTELHACDAVDDPAANDGLFSKFSQDTMAGQITEFLDLNPQVWAAVKSNPSIVEALARYGDKVDEFITRYREYRQHNTQEIDAMSEKPDSEKLENAPSVDQPSADDTPAGDITELEAEPIQTPEETPAEDDTPDATDASEFEVAEADALRARLSAVEADTAQATQRAEAAETDLAASIVSLAEMTEAFAAVVTERDELRQKLAAIEKGAPPLSAVSAPADGELSPWKKAQRK